jgi:hypothetical protein
MTSKLGSEKDFLFVMDVRNEVYYNNPAELSSFLKTLPAAIRIYAIIHAGMNTLKIYCVANNIDDYEIASAIAGAKTDIIDSRSSAAELQ